MTKKRSKAMCKVAIEPREVMELPAVGGGSILVCRSCGQVSLDAQAIDHAEDCVAVSVAIRSPIRSQEPPAVPVAPSPVQSTGATGPTEPIGVSDPAPVQRPTRVKCESCGGTGQHLRKAGAGECMFCGGFGQLPPGFTYCAECAGVISLGTTAFHPCTNCTALLRLAAEARDRIAAIRAKSDTTPADPADPVTPAAPFVRYAVAVEQELIQQRCATLEKERDALLLVVRLLAVIRMKDSE